MNIALSLKEQVNTSLIFFSVFLGIFQFFLCLCHPLGPSQRYCHYCAISGDNQHRVDEFFMGYGAVGFEPGIVALRSGALPLRHFSSSTQIGPKKYLVAFLYTAKSIAAIW
jgi:hypothetical protein